MNTDLRIRQALHGLAASPEPANLADRALRGAARQRRIRLASSAGATVVLALVALGLVRVPYDGGQAPLPGSSSGPPGVECLRYVTVVGLPQDPATWPGVPAAVAAALPQRHEYQLRSGFEWCRERATRPGQITPNAHAEIGVEDPAAGYLALDVYVTNSPAPLGDCTHWWASAATERLFCHEATPATPRVYGARVGSYVWVMAVYANGTAISMQSHAPVGEGPLLVTAEELRSVVTAPDLVATIPPASEITNR
jgi:hypothetical protein